MRLHRVMVQRMTAPDVRSFLDRDWDAIEQETARFWRARKRALGPAEGIRISDELRRQAIATHPDWPDADSRAEDLDAHVTLSRLMKNAGTPVRR